MNKPNKFIVATLIAGAAMLTAATPAMAEVTIGVNLGLPQLYTQPAPVYYAPRPVYVQPQPVYVQQNPVYYTPGPTYVQPQPVYVHGRGHAHRRGPHRDSDGDGVPDRFDRAPNNPYRN